jgi:hypothetical protein
MKASLFSCGLGLLSIVAFIRTLFLIRRHADSESPRNSAMRGW